MIIYVDENVPRKITTQLKAAGYLVEYITRSISDKDILHDLSPKVPMAVRTRVEILTNQTMAVLKSPTRDREQTIKSWTASMQGAITLQSQQRFDEACLAYEVMAGAWPGDKRITELRELTRHW